MTELLSRLQSALADRYRLEREIGAGGMATVYLAEDLKHHRKVALKVLRPELAATLGPERFFREIEVAARLQHPHILALHDSGEAGGFLYYVMPFVEGESLRDRLSRQGELPVHDAVRILAEVADALAYAHKQGVVHRDIKPENILLSGRHALVADFGVAKAVSEATGRQQLTTAGVALGTPAYMAPEQAAADPHLDHRVDIYALGVLGYELLAGRTPFVGKTPQETLSAHVMQPPDPVTRYRATISPALEAVVMKCLAKRPADRFQGADELTAALEPLATPSGGMTPAQTQPVRAVPSRPAIARRWLFPLGAATAIAIVALLASRRSHPPVEVQLGRRIQATLAPGLEIFPALSPDGNLLAYTAGAESRLFVRQVEGGNAIPVARDVPGLQIHPHWSPDGKQLSYSSDRGLEVVPALGGTPRLLVPGTVLAGPWSPDGRELSFVRGDSLFAIAAEGDKVRSIAFMSELHSCDWSPDGKRIACVSGNHWATMPGPAFFGNLAPSVVATVAATGGTPVRVTEDSSANTSPAWQRDGTLLFLSTREGGRDVYAVRLDRAGVVTAPPHRITTGLNAISIAISADGSRLAYAEFHETSNVWSMPVPAGGPVSVASATPVTTGNQVIEWFDVSPDGRWLAFDSDRDGNAHLYRMPLDGRGEAEQLTRGSIDQFWPAISPDGREIAFHSFLEGHRQVYLMPSDGGPATLVTHTDLDDRTPVWLPDGRGLLLTTNQGTTTSELRMVIRKGAHAWGPPTRWRTPDCVVTWSPDGKLAACFEERGRLVLVAPNGDSVRVLVDPARGGQTVGFGNWASDGKAVYYMDAAAANIYSVPAAGGTPRVLVRFDDPTRPWHRFGFEVLRDRIYFTIGDQESDIWVAKLERK
jgi:Tol biopolymer transport system component/tRNA A-37 threonylcarbamoyl transferase component Bud32